MDLLLITARVVHILGGVFWAGTLIFVAWLLVPSVGDAGPDGAKVMGALMKRGMLTIVPVVALLTIVSGFWLYWRLSGGFQSRAWLGSPMAMSLGTGGILSLVALAIGLGIMRPATLKAAGLMQSLAGATDAAAREATMAEVGRLRARSAGAGRVVATLLVLTTLTMAVARYL